VALRVSFFGYLFNLSLKDLLYVISWWIFLLGLMVCILGLQFSLIVVGLWFIAKATSYHLIRLFAEFMDHTGLDYKNDVSLFSRNLPDWGFLRFIFHPNHDTYHIIHHLFPRIPVYNLRKADLILRELEGYNQLHRCDGYFFGDHSAVKCWVGRCQKGNM
jgi:fatty acid desaturase